MRPWALQACELAHRLERLLRAPCSLHQERESSGVDSQVSSTIDTKVMLRPAAYEERRLAVTEPFRGFGQREADAPQPDV